MKPKVYTSIDMNEARSPLVRVVHADEWDLLMNELRYLRGERAAVMAFLQEGPDGWRDTCCDFTLRAHWKAIERGEHRREEER